MLGSRERGESEAGIATGGCPKGSFDAAGGDVPAGRRCDRPADVYGAQIAADLVDEQVACHVVRVQVAADSA